MNNLPRRTHDRPLRHCRHRAGSGGLVGARFAAQLGAKVALVERKRIGGDCTWTGCVPSKALIRAARASHEVRTASRYGIRTAAPKVDMPAVRDYVRSAIQAVSKLETPEGLATEGIDVIFGAAEFIDAHTIRAGERTIRSSAFLLTTGGQPVIPPIPGLKGVEFITYEQIFENDTLPERLVVVGGGPIGMEIAQAYHRLGSDVMVVSKSVLPKEDPEVQKLMKSVLQGEGVRFVQEPAKAVQRDGNATIVVTENHEVRGDLLLVAVGRKPSLEGLQLDKAGVKYSSHGISVDDRLRTNVKHIYAAGDATGGYQFTHYAGWQAFQAVRNALLPATTSGMSDLVPRVTFTDPEVAHIGATEELARTTYGRGVQVLRWGMDKVDRAVCENDLAGFLKIVTKPNGTIVGASMVAARAGESIMELVIAMKRRMKVGDLAGTIHPYPTYSTAFQQMTAAITVEHLLSGMSGGLVRGLSRIVR